MNKKGNFPLMLLFFIIIAVILVAGLFISTGTSVIKIFMDAVIPEIENIGTIGDTSTNITEYSSYALNPVNTLINSFNWLGGVIYFIAFFGLFGIAIGYKVTMSRWLIGLFVLLALLIIIMSVFISNIYEDLYTDSGEFAENIREQKLLSFLILHSPLILSITIFASGIVLFSGLSQEETV